MKEKWIVETKKGDFSGIANELGVSPLLVRCMINRGLETPQEMKRFLQGTLEDLHNPWQMKGMKEAVALLKIAKEDRTKIAIASDFDCDGIFSGFLLWKGFEEVGFDSKIYTPDRVQEGYGLNERIIEEAVAEGRTVLVTCDNGIAANEQVDYAKEKGMTVIVTDHHEVQETLPHADAIVDPKQEGETYPFTGLCGAGVAFKLITALYQEMGVKSGKENELLEYAAIATVADVMELRDENRILVKYGLEALAKTKNVGLQSLIEVQGLQDKTITAGHIGFVLGPCFNAAGRIATVEQSFDLLRETDKEAAGIKAQRLKELNESRKAMTEEGTKKAFAILEEKELDSVLIVLLPDTHESLVGIIAGRVKEHYHHPVIVFTRTEEGMIKGSGRSIETYHMFDELMKCKDLLIRFGGHKMAAGMTLKEEDLPKLKERLNANATLTQEDFRPVIRIDAPMPVGYVTERLVEELGKMEPFGVGNQKPVFAEQHFRILKGQRLGKEKNVLKLQVQNEQGNKIEAMYFGHVEAFEEFVTETFGDLELSRMYQGKENKLDIAFTYYPMVNEFRGFKTMQIQILGFCRVERR